MSDSGEAVGGVSGILETLNAQGVGVRRPGFQPTCAADKLSDLRQALYSAGPQPPQPKRGQTRSSSVPSGRDAVTLPWFHTPVAMLVTCS